MSIASTASVRPSALSSTTVRQFCRAGFVALLAVGAVCAIYGVEKYLLAPPRRFVENPTEVAMRALGLAHFLVGWLFLFTSPRLRSGPALGRLLGLTVLGGGLCAVFALCGGTRNPFVLLFFYGYFLVHEVRDEAALSRAYGDAPERGEAGTRFLERLAWGVALLAAAVLVAAFTLHGGAVERAARYAASPRAALLATFAVLLTAGLYLAARALRAGMRLHGDLRTLLAAHRPLLVVYAGLGLLLVLGSLLGSAAFNLLILLHVAAWLVFVCHQLGSRPAAGRGWWAWLRGTPAGFVTLHVAVALAVLALMALRVHVWERAGWASRLLAASSFPYWSLMHISMAFWRGR